MSHGINDQNEALGLFPPPLLAREALSQVCSWASGRIFSTTFDGDKQLALCGLRESRLPPAWVESSSGGVCAWHKLWLTRLPLPLPIQPCLGWEGYQQGLRVQALMNTKGSRDTRDTIIPAVSAWLPLLEKSYPLSFSIEHKSHVSFRGSLSESCLWRASGKISRLRQKYTCSFASRYPRSWWQDEPAGQTGLPVLMAEAEPRLPSGCSTEPPRSQLMKLHFMTAVIRMKHFKITKR